MSYAVPASAAAEPRRPVTVTLAALLLIVMAVAGLGYAVATIAVVPGVVSRFRAGAATVAPDDVDGVVGLLWLGAGVAIALAVLLFGLYTVLALSLRRGSGVARICTWVVCGLGLLAGCASMSTVLAQRGSSIGDEPFSTFGSVAGPLTDAYPDAWIPLNVALAVGQMLGYLVVAGLLVAAPGHFFGRGAPSTTPAAAPGPYGAYGALPGMPGLYPAPGQPGAGAPGQPTFGPPTFGPPGQPTFGPPGQPTFGPPGQPTFGPPGPPGPLAPGASAPPLYGAPYGDAPADGTPYGQYPQPPADPASAESQHMWSQQPPGQQPPGQQVPGQQVPGQQVPGQQVPGQPGASGAPRSDGDDQFWARPEA